MKEEEKGKEKNRREGKKRESSVGHIRTAKK